MAKKQKMKILIRSAAIKKRVREVAKQISKEFKGERVHLIGVLKGACIFLSDLVREIDLETSIDFIAISTYGKGKESSGQVRVLKDLDAARREQVEGPDASLSNPRSPTARVDKRCAFPHASVPNENAAKNHASGSGTEPVRAPRPA